MPYYNFKRDVKLGKEAEEDVARLLQKHFNWVLHEYNRDIRYDLKFVNTKTKRSVFVEVKVDFMSQHTGNVAIEFECRGKPSGINKTTAQYWVYKIVYGNENKYVFITTTAIKKLIECGQFLRVVTGGDYKSYTKMYLFSLEKFEKKGKVFVES